MERGPCLHCLRHTFAVKSFSKNDKDALKARDAVVPDDSRLLKEAHKHHTSLQGVTRFKDLLEGFKHFNEFPKEKKNGYPLFFQYDGHAINLR